MEAGSYSDQRRYAPSRAGLSTDIRRYRGTKWIYPPGSAIAIVLATFGGPVAAIQVQKYLERRQRFGYDFERACDGIDGLPVAREPSRHRRLRRRLGSRQCYPGCLGVVGLGS
jgi:hypothetical protein